MLDPTRRVELLNRHFDELAKALVSRQLNNAEGYAEQFSVGARLKCVEDARNHLCYLSEALATDRPSIFSNYVAWADEVLTHRGIPTRDLVSHLEAMNSLLSERLPPDIAATVGEYIQEALLKLNGPRSKPESHLATSGPLAELAQTYFDHLLRFQREEAISVLLNAAREGVPVGEIYRHVLEPCQREIGRLWQINEVSVAQEHYCSAATQLAMAQLYRLMAVKAPRGRTALVSAVQGEFHDIGVHMVSDFLETDGWRTFFLGANTPHQALAHTIVALHPDVLALSATITANMDSVRDAIDISRRAGPWLMILVGGAAFNNEPDLCQFVDADAYADDAASAIAVADSLLDGQQRSVA